jgi:hypothetical protein
MIDPWTGWTRPAPDGTWRAVCTAATWSDCWGRVLLVLREPGWQGTMEAVVLETGRHPDMRARPR